MTLEHAVVVPLADFECRNHMMWREIAWGHGKDGLVTIDQDLHPAYLRLTEAVLRPLLRLPAYFSRLDRRKGTDNLDLHQIADELKSSEFEKALFPYVPHIRNGIAHGGVTYLRGSGSLRRQEGQQDDIAHPRHRSEIR